MLKNLSNFATLEVLNSEEVKGGCCYIPRPCGCGYGGQKSTKSNKCKTKSPKTPKKPKSPKCK